MLSAAITGFSTGLSLILVVGAQNAFVLRQGLARSHVFWVCVICALSDTLLIALGVIGSGSLGAAIPGAIRALSLAGAAFLIAYGIISLRRAFKPSALRAAGEPAGSLRAAVLTCLALTWLNPHVYFETVGLIGAISTGIGSFDGRVAYAIGASLASFVFFFSLGYGARFLAPVFEQPGAWAFLDAGIAVVMWSVAAKLLADA